MRKKGIAILGSTGTLGRATLDVVRRHPERFRVVSLSCGQNTSLLLKQIEEFRPRHVTVLSARLAEKVKREVSSMADAPEVGHGREGLGRAVSVRGVDLVLVCVVGMEGFLPTLEAIRRGRTIALANKETLVVGGPLVMKEARRQGVRIIPVDSEHSAIHQILRGEKKRAVKRLILTASGGPFFRMPLEKLRYVTVEDALKHPVWNMGRRITIDSATLMNKGFEVIEARWLFGMKEDKIGVCIHPQGVVHSMVEFLDGSVLSQMGHSDMRIPIAYALGYPERIASGVEEYRPEDTTLEFFPVDGRKYPCLRFARESLRLGGSAPAVLNAADEVAVDMFLKGMIKFIEIPIVIEKTLTEHLPWRLVSPEDVLEADRWGRTKAMEVVKGL